MTDKEMEIECKMCNAINHRLLLICYLNENLKMRFHGLTSIGSHFTVRDFIRTLK